MKFVGIDTLVCFGWRGRPENRGVEIDFKPNFGHRLARSGAAAAARAIFVEVVSRGAPQMTEKIPDMIDLRCHFRGNFRAFFKNERFIFDSLANLGHPLVAPPPLDEHNPYKTCFCRGCVVSGWAEGRFDDLNLEIIKNKILKF